MTNFNKMSRKQTSKISVISGLLILMVSLHLSWQTKERPEEAAWFPFQPTNTHEPGIIGMQGWLDAPAGKHGFVQVNKENLEFENGKPIKFWGTNINGSNAFSSREAAEGFTAFIAKYGINAVRFHKFTWGANAGDQSTQLDPQKFERFDYFQSKLKEKGIYYGWSHIYGHRVLPGDSSDLVAYSEIKNLKYPWAHLNGSTSSLVNFAPDLQDLNIALTVNMLNHTNPHTGLKYAEDPGLAFIEFQNEDNIFWSAIERALEQAPTYRAMLCRQFSEWLLEKYGSQEQLERAWGRENVPEESSFKKMNFYPQPNHSLFSSAYEVALEQGQKMPVDILDKMRFLYEQQLAFYKKFERAVRATGYKGVIVGSCWQAGSGISHLYNLHADYEVGMIDRHNYFGGGAGGHQLSTGTVKNASMLEEPGSALLSTGMQQVMDRPFSFSEWMSLVPNQWTAEAAPIIAAYGMGLQGWDASFSFAVDIPRFSPFLESAHHGVYNATSPLHMGLYPALARMVYRNDVRESPLLGTRNVHVPSLEKEIPGFEEIVDQGFDDKQFSGSLSLAIGKVPIKFTEGPENTQLPDLSEYHDVQAKNIISVTKELFWSYGEHDYFSINTPGTKGLVGFIPDDEIHLGDWTLATDNKFAVILISSLSENGRLGEGDKFLLTTVARAKNTGMRYNESGNELFSKGTDPLLLEPVNLSLKAPEGQKYKVTVLDHDGLPTGKVISGTGRHFEISGADSQAIYYLLERSK
jgi:hypothetical protein